MRIELNLGQKQSQKLIMTQSLQQSIEILRFSNEELNEFLQEKSLENPFLDVNIVSDFVNVPVRSSNQNASHSKEPIDIYHIKDKNISLRDYLISQINLEFDDTFLRKIILYLTENLDANGYLDINLEEAQQQTAASIEILTKALSLLQQLDPPGVGARNLQECLLLQVQRIGEKSPPCTYEILKDNFDDFVHKRWAKIAEIYRLELNKIQKIADFIRNLSPYPGGNFGEVDKNYIVPDVIVHIENNNITLSSNKSGKQKIIFRSKYFDKISKLKDEEVQTYLKEKKDDFDLLQKNIIQRDNTILRVSNEIVNIQHEFFLNPSNPLKALKLKDIAKKLELHESTVSRAVNGKYLQTNFGVFELKYFFNAGLAQKNVKEDISTAKIKQRIKEFVKEENKRKPLSDQKIVELIKKEGIQISRRAIAKYREELNIPSSTNRRRYD
ncbi:RNA polymerase factor sigma-54 [Niallia sp. Man26]|uniref:RNA polymerase factor sigma-54 n=1 Tax=Niallia sp. Man26 TaxID=2912824 RepID=UPI001ED9E63F|nr:RNA polymerase factor sigma-54 [Niallia sp. Man26]UPO90137.1 RNA polymerase factor sigma-54 [Niallia sp. Man26]